MQNSKNLQINEFTFKDIFHILKKYKWSIIFITILFTVIGASYVYLKPRIYSAYAIIKVKPSLKNLTTELIGNSETKNSKDVTEEITLLKTFQINKKVLDKINFDVQYFNDEKYKKVEIYKDIPIHITNIKILDTNNIKLQTNNSIPVYVRSLKQLSKKFLNFLSIFLIFVKFVCE